MKKNEFRAAGMVALVASLLGIAQPGWAESRDDLFADDDAPLKSSPTLGSGASGNGPKGFVQFEAARTTADPVHWSKLRLRSEIGGQGTLGTGIKWKASARLGHDAVFDVNDHYPAAVVRDQRTEATLRETYIDFGVGELDFRVGRQHVVWGEMVGLFFADVVSARNLREFILPEFDMLRTPQ